MRRIDRLAALGGWTLLALLIVAAPSRGQSLRTVPTDHWAYPLAEEVLLRHPELGRNLWLANRPWREADFQALVARADSASLRAGPLPAVPDAAAPAEPAVTPPGERAGYRIVERGAPGASSREAGSQVAAWLDLLADAFPPHTPTEEEVYYHNEVSVYGAADVRKDDVSFDPAFLGVQFGDSVGEPVARVFAQHDFGVQFRESFVLGWRYALDSNVRNDPTRFRQGEVRSGEEFGFAILDAYGTAHWGPLWVTVGRNAFEWGPGRASAVFVSDSIPPLDQARIELGTRQVRFSGVVSRLSSDPQNRSFTNTGVPISNSMPPPEDERAEVNRYLYLHRVDWQPLPRLQVAVSEAALVTGIDRGIEFRYANLLAPFFVTQKDEDEVEDEQVDLYVELDGTFTAPGGLRLYGQLMVGNVNIGDDNPNSRDDVAWRLGGEWGPDALPVTAGAEYTRVDVFTYLHRGLNTNYTQFGVPIGSMLGPDADSGAAWLSWWMRPTLRLTADLLARRDGERNVFSSDLSTDAKPDFPSGVVQKELRAGLEAWTLLPAWGLEATGRVSWTDVKDLGHVEGTDEQFWRAYLGLRYRGTFQ